jgi:hypothetical protein
MSTDPPRTEADSGDGIPAKQDASHHRSDSALSMDSFVRIHDTSFGMDDLATTPPGKPPAPETIDRSPGGVVQPSFQSLLHAHNTGAGSDSDTIGDGSVVFTYDVGAPASKDTPMLPSGGGGVAASRPLPSTPARDRFPSYDSAGSSGSVVRKAISAGKSQPAHPVILPYHERRKLMQQRQQQQQQQQLLHQQQVSSRGPPRSSKIPQPSPPPHPPNHPHVPPNPSLSSHFAALEGGRDPEHGYHMLSTNDPQKNSQHFRQPSFEAKQRTGDFGNGSQEQFLFHHGSTVPMQSTWGMEEPRSFVSKPAANALAYHVGGDLVSGREVHAPVNQWYTSSSFDSLTDLERPAHELTDIRGTVESSESEMLPEATRSGVPPPPPPPNPATHVYRDSMGSFSSLGSLDRSANNRGDGKGYFPQVNPWVSPTPKSQSNTADSDARRGAFVDSFLSKFDQRDLQQSHDGSRIMAR